VSLALKATRIKFRGNESAATGGHKEEIGNGWRKGNFCRYKENESRGSEKRLKQQKYKAIFGTGRLGLAFGAETKNYFHHRTNAEESCRKTRVTKKF